MASQPAFTRIGTGSLGAKAGGLARVAGLLEAAVAPAFRPEVEVEIPRLTVVATDVFDHFLEENDLSGLRTTFLPDQDVAAIVARASLPASLLDDLGRLVETVRTPLAVRSSSLLEDAVGRPFAGVYATRMVANQDPDPARRRDQLAGAIKYVYASTFFRRAKDYLAAAGRSGAQDKMGVLIQEVVGTECRGHFYPHISGVARSLNFYPFGPARPEDGVVDLALGLGKAIVDDGVAWTFSPACPQANPPYNRVRDLLNQSQKEFWAISLTDNGDPATSAQDALRRYLVADAELDGSLKFVASTYLADDDRAVMGVDRSGPRIVDFAPVLKADLVPLSRLVRALLDRCREIFAAPVEIEFAMALREPAALPARFGFLQIRPMADSYSPVEIRVDQLHGPDVLVASESALGNGEPDPIHDIVYVRPTSFDPEQARAIPAQLEKINRTLVLAKRPYILMGPGRWGSSDPSAGVPVDFARISGARVIVESTLSETDLMLSQGSHFFHNVVSFKVLYFSVTEPGAGRVDWAWLDARPAVFQTDFVRHVWLQTPLRVRVDGRSGRGVILR